jgi:hypothetical protein
LPPSTPSVSPSSPRTSSSPAVSVVSASRAFSAPSPLPFVFLPLVVFSLFTLPQSTIACFPYSHSVSEREVRLSPRRCSSTSRKGEKEPDAREDGKRYHLDCVRVQERLEHTFSLLSSSSYRLESSPCANEVYEPKSTLARRLRRASWRTFRVVGVCEAGAEEMQKSIWAAVERGETL